MVEAIKPYASIPSGRFGSIGPNGPLLRLTFPEVTSLLEVSAWPDTKHDVEKLIETVTGVTAPEIRRASLNDNIIIYRSRPMVWRIINAHKDQNEKLESIDPTLGSCVNLSHSFPRIHLEGPAVTDALNRLIPIDLRNQSFKIGDVATTELHHVAVTLHRQEIGYDLYIPRAFFRATWESIQHAIAPFGYTIDKSV